MSGRIRDRGVVLVDNNEIAILDDAKYFEHRLIVDDDDKGTKNTNSIRIDLLIENMGRTNGPVSVMNHAHTGLLWEDDWRLPPSIRLDQKPVQNITVFSLDFIKRGNDNEKWEPYYPSNNKNNHHHTGPAMYRAVLNITTSSSSHPDDTFIQLPGWTKGNIFVNGFNLGRYWYVGPQQTLYLPGPLLKMGENHIDVFELHQPGSEIHFADRMIWNQPSNTKFELFELI